MASIKCMIVLIAILGISYDALGAIEDPERNLLGLSFPYGRGLVKRCTYNINEHLWNRMISRSKHFRREARPSFRKCRKLWFQDNELQLARLLLLPPRLYHPKRNSELINSLLGLPKNMNNAGK